MLRKLSNWALLAWEQEASLKKGVQPQKCGSSHESLCPYQAFEAKDGPIMIGVANDNLWRKFCAAVGLETIVDHPDFRSNADRVRNRAVTLGYVQAALATGTVNAFMTSGATGFDSKAWAGLRPLAPHSFPSGKPGLVGADPGRAAHHF